MNNRVLTFYENFIYSPLHWFMPSGFAKLEVLVSSCEKRSEIFLYIRIYPYYTEYIFKSILWLSFDSIFAPKLDIKSIYIL